MEKEKHDRKIFSDFSSRAVQNLSSGDRVLSKLSRNFITKLYNYLNWRFMKIFSRFRDFRLYFQRMIKKGLLFLFTFKIFRFGVTNQMKVGPI